VYKSYGARLFTAENATRQWIYAEEKRTKQNRLYLGSGKIRSGTTANNSRTAVLPLSQNNSWGKQLRIFPQCFVKTEPNLYPISRRKYTVSQKNMLLHFRPISWTRIDRLQQFFGTVITKCIGHRKIFLFSHHTYFVHLFYFWEIIET